MMRAAEEEEFGTPHQLRGAVRSDKHLSVREKARLFRSLWPYVVPLITVSLLEGHRLPNRSHAHGPAQARTPSP